MMKVITYPSESGTLVRWDSLWNEIILKEERVHFYYGVLPLYQERGQVLRTKTVEGSFEDLLAGKFDEKIESTFGRNTLEEVKRSIVAMGGGARKGV